jgi:hypothetical protein
VSLLHLASVNGVREHALDGSTLAHEVDADSVAA